MWLSRRAEGDGTSWRKPHELGSPLPADVLPQLHLGRSKSAVWAKQNTVRCGHFYFQRDVSITVVAGDSERVVVAPRGRERSVRPQRSTGASEWPLNFTVGRSCCRGVRCSNLKQSAAVTAVTYATPYQEHPSNHWCAIVPIAGVPLELNRWDGSSCAPNNSQ